MQCLWGRGKPALEMHTCPKYRRARLEVEELEPREVLSPLTPIQTRHAYGFDRVSFTVNGQAIRADGSGQTIAIVVAYDHSRIFQDVDAFSRAFTLGSSSTLYQEYGPASSWLTKVAPQGKPGTDSTGLWALEAALDVEWAHAIAPKAKVLLVEAKSNAFMDLMNAVDYARRQPGISVVSLSWGAKEFSSEIYYDSYFTTPAGHLGGSNGRGGALLPGGVTFVAASGDSGAPGLWPGVSTNVVSVGGTSLRVDSAGNYVSEVGWKGSGGGISAYERKPGYQNSISISSTRRVGPDVAYNADPSTGFYVYHSLPINGRAGTWWAVGGTSIAAPQWAGLIAIANQGRALAGLGSLDGASQTLPALYKLPSTDFHDVTSGWNGYYARTGFDLVTGRGSPHADRIIRDLVAYNVKTGSFTTTTVKVNASGPSLAPASLFVSIVPENFSTRRSWRAEDWQVSLLGRTALPMPSESSQGGYRLAKLLRAKDDQGIEDLAARLQQALGSKEWSHQEVDGCFAGEGWALAAEADLIALHAWLD